jgi:Rieske Fe-S protein
MSRRRLSRRQFIRMGTFLSVGSVVAPTVAGCGNGRTTRAPSSVGSDVRRPKIRPGQVIAAKSDVEPNSAVPYADATTGQPEVLVRLADGRFVAYSAVCTHQGCTVAYRPETRELACPCHGGVFDPARGAAVVAGPPPRPLPEVEIEVGDGKVFKA